MASRLGKRRKGGKAERRKGGKAERRKGGKAERRKGDEVCGSVKLSLCIADRGWLTGVRVGQQRDIEESEF